MLAYKFPISTSAALIITGKIPKDLSFFLTDDGRRLLSSSPSDTPRVTVPAAARSRKLQAILYSSSIPARTPRLAAVALSNSPKQGVTRLR